MRKSLCILINSPGRKAGDRTTDRAWLQIDSEPSGWSRQRNHRGFLVLDALLGLALIATASLVLLGTIKHERAAELRLTDSRSAVHLAEHALMNLQHGQPVPALSPDTQLTIRSATGGSAPAGYVWVKVEAAVHGQHRQLFGVIPAGSLPTAGDK